MLMATVGLRWLFASVRDLGRRPFVIAVAVKRLTGVLDVDAQLLPHHLDAAGSRDPELYAVAVDAEHLHPDIALDPDTLLDLPHKNEHPARSFFPPLGAGKAA